MFFIGDRLSSSQALTATALSTDKKDFGGDFDMGAGEAACVVVKIEVAADYTSANETYQFDLVTDDNSSFSSPVTLLSTGAINGNLLPVGREIVLPLPNQNEQYLAVNYVLGGTTPTVTVSAYFALLKDANRGGVIYDSNLVVG